MSLNFSMHGAHKIHSLLSFPYFSKRVLITLWMNENNAHLCNLRAFLIGLFIVGVASRQFAFRWSKTNVHISIANKCFWSNVYFLNWSIYCKIVSQFSSILDWTVRHWTENSKTISSNPYHQVHNKNTQVEAWNRRLRHSRGYLCLFGLWFVRQHFLQFSLGHFCD